MPNTSRTQNIQNNLMSQINSIMKNNHEKSYKTQTRYYNAEKQFVNYLSEVYKLQKIKNVNSKHLSSYVQYMQQNNYSASSVKTNISAIRFFHRLSGSKNILIDNEALNLEKRTFGKMDRAWSSDEYEKALRISKESGRLDVHFALKLSKLFGLRIEETVKCQVNHIKDAVLNTNELYVKGKNGKVRYIPVRTLEQIDVLKEVLTFAKSQNKHGNDKIITKSEKYAVAKETKSLQNWILNNRRKFEDDRKSANMISQNSSKKPKSEHLTFHGLRYLYAQKRYEEETNTTTLKEAKRTVSYELGHNREEVTNIYLSNISKGKKH